jgi:hypothetical protein
MLKHEAGCALPRKPIEVKLTRRLLRDYPNIAG